MQTTLIKNTRAVQIPHRAVFEKKQIGHNGQFEQSVHLAVQDAFLLGGQFAQKAIIAGLLLSEMQQSLGHGAWGPWLEKHYPENPRRTITRWMAAASRVTKALNFGDFIDIEAESISSVLTMPEAELSDKGREARQLFLDFTADKTIADCLRDVVDGSSPDKRITLAYNGKNTGGHKGEDRKDFPMFSLQNLAALNGQLKHWKTMTDVQRLELQQIVRASITGDSIKLPGRQRADKCSASYQMWPEELAKVALEAIKERLKGVKL